MRRKIPAIEGPPLVGSESSPRLSLRETVRMEEKTELQKISDIFYPTLRF
jgi:hypothetical protein